MTQNYQPYQTYPEFEQPEPKRGPNRTVLIVVLVLLALCCCCLIFIPLMYFVLGDMITEALGITYIVPALSALL